MKKYIVLVTVLLIFAACSQSRDSHYVFKGESEHWEAQYKYDSSETWKEKNGKKSYENNQQYELSIIYKGTVQELATLKKLQYSYETVLGGGERTMSFSKPTESKVFKDSGSSNGVKVPEDSAIKVIVKWDGQEETLELKTKN